MMNLRPSLLLAATVLLLVAACAGTPTVASPSPSSSPPPASGPVTSGQQAVARIVAGEKRLAGIAPRDPAGIGQADWYEATPVTGSGPFAVTVRIGWGDCEAGCIDEHRWQYTVAADGTVALVSQTGPVVPDAAWPSSVATGRTGIVGSATAGPVCPVVRNPPDPACADRPVAGAVILIKDASGHLLARATTGADGSFFVEIPPGGYVVEPQPVNGLMGTAGSQPVTVNAGAASTVKLDYDTGIR